MSRIAPKMQMEYVDEIPVALPPGKLLVHNHVRPGRRLSLRGFRAWLAPPNPKYEVCPCPWAPNLPEHYRVRGMRMR